MTPRTNTLSAVSYVSYSKYLKHGNLCVVRELDGSCLYSSYWQQRKAPPDDYLRCYIGMGGCTLRPLPGGRIFMPYMPERKSIKQIFLPPYSPNLNLIERLWKFLRKKVINAGFYRAKEEFRRAIMRFFDNLGIFREELASLLALNFRLANSQSISF